ncbi:DUF3325 domain-containing protein [Stenotrophomonas maltophilia]|uniref:DUF3325 domain-containing protein n=1 Tax=Stenotrophomonas maltophilia TaxID=40324 RepID=UPI0015E002EF|nr:DUF3325 domain-containing protein [Stenotrophomonas maltophilia]MBA0279606.1 DUF3325 domain-containing protein [Stenotrophomonas maltophilia]MBA0343747.1 DUF3325 domain-containing protein [Stenotrophomonas maltophilia]MBA0355986.1 DUF3325 domain-containing protein [Stenotrophomonas maltophilia]MBA0518007.1 DUF3325 domain-containing protein [Stenotrophomonas maltophilia]
MIHVILFVLSLAAFACLALAMERHQRDVLHRLLSVTTTQQLRAVGWALLVFSTVFAMRGLGVGTGLAALSGHTSVAAGVVMLAMVAHGRWNR